MADCRSQGIGQRRIVGYAKRDIEDHEIIEIVINPDGSLESDDILFAKGITIEDLKYSKGCK
jgi:hypothetical protein